MRAIAVPVKSLDRTKSRLSPLLSAAERAVLTLAMLEDVLDACLAQRSWDVWVVSADEAVLEIAARRSAHPLVEEGRTLGEAVRQSEGEIRGAGGELAIVLGDLPLLTPTVLERALAVDAPVVAAAAASDGGTNMLVRRPPSIIPARFGRASFAKHRWAARRERVRFEVARDPELAFDLDRPEDVARLVATDGSGLSRAVCLELGLADRLRARA
jgi:2-phospho-L-lactate/phosphoenolpyruvate guanylyltransferase